MIDFKELETRDISNLTFVITGANSGIGYESALFFASKKARVFLCARNHQKAQVAKDAILLAYPQAKIDLVSLDLADFSSIKTAAQTILNKTQHIDVLLNNAGIMAVPYQKTRDGFEVQMGVNHLGHVYFTSLLLNNMASHARIVNVSSMAHLQGRLDFSNMMFEKGKYQAFASYARSKLANLMFTEALNNSFKEAQLNVTALSAHPGIAKTSLFDKEKQTSVFASILRRFDFILPSAQAGAKAIIAACIDPNAQAGQFYGPYQSKKNNGNLIRLERIHARVQDDKTIEQFWRWTQDKVSSIAHPLTK